MIYRVRLVDVEKTFNKKSINVDVLKGINLTVKRGDMVCIMGVSGTGKTTLLNIISGLLPMTKGKYYYDNVLLDTNSYKEMEKFRHEKVGIILQEFGLIKDLSVYENIVLPLKYRKCQLDEEKEKIEKIVELLNLKGKEENYPEELSGGQQQCVAIARALAKQVELIVADEPTGSLDEYHTSNVMNIFKQINQNKITIIIATHDYNIASMCNKKYVIRKGILEEI